MMAESGAREILVAHPIIGDEKLRLARRAHPEGKDHRGRGLTRDRAIALPHRCGARLRIRGGVGVRLGLDALRSRSGRISCRVGKENLTAAPRSAERALHLLSQACVEPRQERSAEMDRLKADVAATIQAFATRAFQRRLLLQDPLLQRSSRTLSVGSRKFVPALTSTTT